MPSTARSGASNRSQRVSESYSGTTQLYCGYRHSSSRYCPKAARLPGEAWSDHVAADQQAEGGVGIAGGPADQGLEAGQVGGGDEQVEGDESAALRQEGQRAGIVADGHLQLEVVLVAAVRL